LDSETIYGYFTQEYLAHYLKYSENLQRQDEWDTKNCNILFVWPMNSQAFILQDSKFYGAPSLNMTQARSRIQMLLQLLVNYHKFERTGDCILRPYERILTKHEMLDALLRADEPVTEARIDLGTVTQSLPEVLSVFNPRDDWNRIITEIIQEYELPNISAIVFNATRLGTVGKSMFVKALALAGQVRRIKLGRGKLSRTVKQKIPTHVGRVVVSDPATDEDVANIISFLQDRLNLALTSHLLKVTDAVQQMRFEF
jgi:hypothetical protein